MSETARRGLLLGGIAAALAPRRASACSLEPFKCEKWRQSYERAPAVVVVEIVKLELHDVPVPPPNPGAPTLFGPGDKRGTTEAVVVEVLKGEVAPGLRLTYAVESGNFGGPCPSHNVTQPGGRRVLYLGSVEGASPLQWRVVESEPYELFVGRSRCLAPPPGSS